MPAPRIKCKRARFPLFRPQFRFPHHHTQTSLLQLPSYLTLTVGGVELRRLRLRRQRKLGKVVVGTLRVGTEQVVLFRVEERQGLRTRSVRVHTHSTLSLQGVWTVYIYIYIYTGWYTSVRTGRGTRPFQQPVIHRRGSSSLRTGSTIPQRIPLNRSV